MARIVSSRAFNANVTTLVLLKGCLRAHSLTGLRTSDLSKLFNGRNSSTSFVMPERSAGRSEALKWHPLNVLATNSRPYKRDEAFIE